MSTIKAKNVNHPGYQENLKAGKYNIIREVMLAVLPDDVGMLFDDLEAGVAAYWQERDVPQTMFPKLGSVRWYTKTVQLDSEARGEIERLPNQSPIQLRKRNST